MAFVKKTWKDRISEYPNRRTINDGNTTKTVTVGRDEGEITEAGDAFNAANMNDLEQRIYDATRGGGGGGGASELADLDDVDISTPTGGQALLYDDVSEKWVNGNVSSSEALDDLTDVDISTPSDGQALLYDSANSKWKNGAVASSVASLTDVNLTNLADGEILKYDSASGKWVNATESGGASWTDLTGTLTAGQTTLTIQNAVITTDSTFDFYTSVFGVCPIDVAVTTGQIVLTFNTQSVDINVKVRVTGERQNNGGLNAQQNVVVSSTYT